MTTSILLVSLLAAVVPVADMPSLSNEAAGSEVFSSANKSTARIWNFMGSAPQGGKLGAMAAIDEKGLCSTNLANQSKPAGFRLNERFTPSGAFVFAADFIAGGAGAASGSRESVLWDDMAVTYPAKATNRGFQLMFTVADEKWTPVFYGGNGKSTASCRGPTATLAPGSRGKLRMYFGADGRVVWDFCGIVKETEFSFEGSLAPAERYNPVIGDRAVSNHRAFDGVIRRVAIASAKTPEFTAHITGRAAFRRDEVGASVKIELVNQMDSVVAETVATIEQFVESGRVRREEIALGSLESKERRAVEFAVETRVRPGWHPLRVTVNGKTSSGRIVRQQVLRLGSGPVVTERMPTLMWGFTAPTAELATLGFTHGLTYTWKIGPNLSKVDPVPTFRMLDQALVDGIGLTRNTRVRYPNEDSSEPDPDVYMRRTRDSGKITHGKNKRESPEVSHPDMAPYLRKLAADDAQVFGAHPAFVGMLPCSEVRDGTGPSFNTEHLKYRRETGRDVPDEVVGKTISYKKINEVKQRYPDGIVPEDDPLLQYYRWFWSGGDGWPEYTGTLSEEYHRHISRPDFFVFWDPAVRCPPRWGSGGNVDMLNQWVYANPEPMNVAGPCEELFAMASGRPGQQVSIMTQLICYRARVAPKDKKVTPEPEWVRRRPDADFPTIPPDSLQEAVWSMIAKPVQAIMFHGWGTIYETGASKGYTYTNPESRERIATLLKDVVAPIGPMLRKLGRAPQPVAVFESFTTSALGGPASFGWTVPAITFFQRARLDPRVVYEETILRDGLDGIKVLYMPQCLFMPPSVLERIREFQKRGGIIIADEQCLKAIVPDITVPIVSFQPVPESDHTEDINALEAAKEGDAKTRAATMRMKAKMVAQADELRRQLVGRFTPAADSSSADIVTYLRKDGDTDYLFAVNDRRTFGDYFGPWGLTMEKGLPNEGWVSVVDSGVKAVYELSRGGKVRFDRKDGKVVLPVKFDTNDGRLFAFLRDEITSLEVNAVFVAEGKVHVRLTVLGANGKPVRSLLPVEIRLSDSSGREVDGSGYSVAKDGVCEMDIITNVEDAPGAYRLFCRDRASGLEVRREVKR